jgi:hypothetical protein
LHCHFGKLSPFSGNYFKENNTLSTFEISWPWVVDKTLTAASYSNFNFGFLSPRCLLPFFEYEYEYFLQISLPILVLIGFTFLYFLGTTRSLFASVIGKRIAKILKLKYVAPFKQEDLDDDEKLSKKDMTKRSVEEFKFTLYNLFIYLYNVLLWVLKEPFTFGQNRLFFYKLVNAYLSFVSLFFIRIMTTSSQIFVCKSQPDGRLSLNASPDIFW